MGKYHRRVVNAFLFVFLSVVSLFLLLPLCLILFESVRGGFFGGTLSPRTLKVFRFSFLQALLSSSISVALGIPGAYIFGKTSFPFKGLLFSVTLVTFVLPGVIVALSFFSLLGREGIITKVLNALFGLKGSLLFSFWTIIGAHVLYNIPVAIRIIGGTWGGIPDTLDEQARVDGASEMGIFLRIHLPILVPSILSAFLLIFIYCFMSFSVVLILGGGRFSTVEVEIYTLSSVLLDFRKAAILSAIQMLVLGGFALCLSSLGGYAEIFVGEVPTYRRLPWWGVPYMVLLLTYIFIPIVTVVFQGFWDPFNGKLTLNWFLRLFKEGYMAPVGASVPKVILNSLLLASVSSSIAGLLATVAAFLRLQSKRFLDLLSVLPLIVSPLSIGLGYFILETYFFEIPTLLKLSILHALLALPLFYRAILGRWGLIPRELVDAAMVDGATRLRAFTSIELPLLLPAFTFGMSLSVASSLGELALILMLGSDFPTLSLAIYRLFSSHRIEEAKALGSILVIFTLLLFWLAERSASEKRVY